MLLVAQAEIYGREKKREQRSLRFVAECLCKVLSVPQNLSCLREFASLIYGRQFYRKPTFRQPEPKDSGMSLTKTTCPCATNSSNIESFDPPSLSIETIRFFISRAGPLVPEVGQVWPTSCWCSTAPSANDDASRYS